MTRQESLARRQEKALRVSARRGGIAVVAATLATLAGAVWVADARAATGPPASQTAHGLQVADSENPSSACPSSKVQVLFDDTLMARRGIAAEATGIIPWSETNWQLVSCTISFDPARWVEFDRAQRCRLLVHEVLHLDGRRHTSHAGIMNATLDRNGSPWLWFSPCQTIRERILRNIENRFPGNERWVQAGRWQGRVLPVTVELTKHTVRYRCRTSNDVFACSRVSKVRRHA